MDHRHPTPLPVNDTSAAIDQIIVSGSRSDWGALRILAIADSAVLEALRNLCERRTAVRGDPSAEGHLAWLAYIESVIATDTDCTVLRLAHADAREQR